MVSETILLSKQSKIKLSADDNAAGILPITTRGILEIVQSTKKIHKRKIQNTRNTCDEFTESFRGGTFAKSLRLFIDENFTK